MKKIIDYLFYRYYLISIKNEEFPRFGATCVLAEVVTMVYLFAALILSFLLTGDFFLPSTSGYHLSTLQQKKNKRFSGKISKQQIQYQIFRQGGVKPPLYSTNSRAYSDAVTLSVQITADYGAN